MLIRRLSLLIVLFPALGLSGNQPQSIAPSEPTQPDPKEPPQPPPGWIASQLTEIDRILDAEIKDLIALYQHLHANPELSLMEEKTAARLAAEMKKLGYEVTEKFGGHGVVAVMKNGDGPIVLIRTDMDGLPITEQTGLPYASKVRVKNRDGLEVGVMHACGHDIHMTCWIGTARILARMNKQWRGTVIFIAQPAEEIVAGAKLMLDAGLYSKFPRPDYALALHADSLTPAGTISYSEGLALASADTVDIIVKGKGGHAAAPHLAIDPVVLAARIILDLQTIVSRETDPFDPVVITVGSIHGGTKHNIIPNEVKLQLTVRTTKTETRDRVLKAIDRIARAAATGANAPPPEVKVNLEEFTPATYNNVPLTRRCAALFRQALGTDNVLIRKPMMGAEDFSRYSDNGKIPILMFFLGTISKDKYEAAQRPGAARLPGMHTDAYAPLPEPSIRTGARTMSLAALHLLQKREN